MPAHDGDVSSQGCDWSSPWGRLGEHGGGSTQATRQESGVPQVTPAWGQGAPSPQPGGVGQRGLTLSVHTHSCCEHSCLSPCGRLPFLVGRYLGVRWLDHTMGVCVTFQDTSVFCTGRTMSHSLHVFSVSFFFIF